MADLRVVLKKYFGYDEFRSGQEQVINAILQKRDVLAIMPTGGGKSLCYQLPALVQPGLTLVVSPLIALMQDQVAALLNTGITATFLNSTLTTSERGDRIDGLLGGQFKLLYMAPETLFSDLITSLLGRLHTNLGIDAIAIDEAHCVSEWGHDFRAEYCQLSHLRDRFPQVPMVALTATATERVRADIMAQLGLRQPLVHLSSFDRPNLYYEVRTDRSFEHLVQQVRNSKGSGIIYGLTRKQVDAIAEKLTTNNLSALPYHGGLADGVRREHQERWLRDDVQVMVATIAFGMGINKPDVRFVIHYELAKNIEGYYQESGRAGRDGDPAHCTLYFALNDVETIKYFIKQKTDPQTGEPLELQQRIALQQLNQIIDYAEGSECRRATLLRYFNQEHGGNCGQCDRCCFPLIVKDWTVPAQKFLSCVARTQERFGIHYIIQILRGSRQERIRLLGHDRLSVYGIGQDLPPTTWRNLGRSLLHKGYVSCSDDGYGILRLNALSWQIMKKELPVMIGIPEPAPRSPRSRTSGPPLGEPADITLFEQLRALRKKLADQQKIPPYMIFADRTLLALSRTQPQTLDDFAKIPGVGERKLALYGTSFIEVIAAFQGLKTRKY
ncbi:MAG: DNA helicase RecQ [Oscillatoriales cyanobacterium SM2_2_1]|nr:DNA helicase RecQ [Oscillatoriales cyanobacterium SM2_2_1]